MIDNITMFTFLGAAVNSTGEREGDDCCNEYDCIYTMQKISYTDPKMTSWKLWMKVTNMDGYEKFI